ncbi:hypothetical protein [Persephonella sp.]
MRIIPILIGADFNTVEELLEDDRAVRELWLEILFNDEIDWEKYLDNPVVKEQYKKACKYYRAFGYLLDRKPLFCEDYSETDRNFPEYRRFEEILNFLSWSKNRIIP